jgi:LacI family transcriptional regulator
VVNNQQNVDPGTRVKVLAVANSLNYQPNIAARGLAAGRSRVLGLVIPMGVSTLFADPYYPLLIQGISSACNEHDHSVMLWLADPEYERRTISQILRGGLIDGVIVASALMDDAVCEALRKDCKPFILIGRHLTDASISYVDVDNVGSAREMVAHLLRLGHRKVATISGPERMIAGSDRLQGYLLALRDRSLRPDSNLIIEGDFTETGGYASMQRLLPFKPDAVFAASDASAIGALRAIRDAGLRVPDDIGVAGFDDMPFAARADPPLTSVRQPISRAGSLAVETLIDLVAHPNSPPRRTILPTELIIRSSCGSTSHRNGVRAESLSPQDAV